MAPAPATSPAPEPTPREARPAQPPRAATPAPTPRSTPARPAPVDRVVVAPGEPFELALGQTSEVQGTDLSIRFASVAEDSRCPEGAQCIVAGKARILLNVSGGGEGPAVVELATAPEAADAVRDGQTIRLLELTPHPSMKRSIRPADYRARLVVGNL